MGRYQIGLIIIVGMAFCYPIAMRLISHAMRRTRAQFLQLGDDLLGSRDLPEWHKRLITQTIEDAYDVWFMPCACLMFPVFSVLWMTHIRRPSIPDIADKTTRIKFDDYMTCHMQLCAAANPIFAVLFGVECAVLSFFLSPLGMEKQRVGVVQATVAEMEEKRWAHHTSAAKA